MLMTLLLRTTDEKRTGTATAARQGAGRLEQDAGTSGSPPPSHAARGRLMRVAIALAVAVVAVLVLTQLLLPRYVEGRIETRLTRNGGIADVSIDVLPALRLLAGDGDRLTIRGSGLDLEIESVEPRLWKRLDRFDAVDIRLTAVRTGPLRTEAFFLQRPEGSSTYLIRSRSTVVPAELVGYAASRFLPGAFGGTLSGLAATVPGGERAIPLDVDVRIASDDGRPRVVSGSGSFAGIPTALIVELVGSAVAKRL
jgi:hypothetical protein